MCEKPGKFCDYVYFLARRQNYELNNFVNNPNRQVISLRIISFFNHEISLIRSEVTVM